MTASGYSTWTTTDKAIKAAARTISEEQGRDFHMDATTRLGYDPEVSKALLPFDPTVIGHSEEPPGPDGPGIN